MSNSPRPIRRDIKFFISAVTRELGSVRKLLKRAIEENDQLTKELDDEDYHAIEQDNFQLDHRTIEDKLRTLIHRCDGVIHIAGFCYGAEPTDEPSRKLRRSYTQLEYEIALELGKPVYVFVTEKGFRPDPYAPEPKELQELQLAHRNRLVSKDRDKCTVRSRYQLDRNVRSLRLKVEILEGELQRVDWVVVDVGRRLGRRIAVVASLILATLGAVVFFGWQQQVGLRAQQEEFRKAELARQAKELRYFRTVEEAARKEAQTIQQVQQDFAERFLQQLLANKEIKAEDARERALKELPALVKLPLAEIQSLIDRKIAPRATERSLSSLERARAALAKGNYDEVFQAADGQKEQGRELAMLEGTAALARFRQSPQPEWKVRALAAFQRAMALADPNSPAEWQAWTDAAISAASVLHDLARYAKAEPLLRQSQQLHEANTRPDSPRVAEVLNNLALLLKATNRLPEAEPLFRRALAIDEKSYGPDHPNVAIYLNNLAELLRATNRLSEAEPLYRRAIAIGEKSYGPDQPDVATRLNNLAELLRVTNRLSQAEPLYRRSLAIDEKSYGPDHPNVAICLNNLAGLLEDTNRLSEAEPLYRRSLAIDEKSYGPDHPDVATRLNNLASLLRVTNRLLEAEPLSRRALAIDEKSFGPDHPDVAIDLNNLALLLQVTNRLSEAEPLYRRALAIHEKSYGPDHPSVATRLNNLAGLLEDTNRRSEAEPLYRRALEIDEKSYGPEHPKVAIRLNNLAGLLRATNRLSAAELLLARAVGILSRFQRSTGHEHPHLREDVENYAQLLTELKLAEPEIARRINSAREGTEKLPPIVREVERLLGPAKPVADTLRSLNRQYREQGKPGVYFLKPDEPLAPHLGELLRPNGDRLSALGVQAIRGGAPAEAIVLCDAALELMAYQPAEFPAKLTARMSRAVAMRELGLTNQARDELVRLLAELDQSSGLDPAAKGRARYHLALCQWRLGDRASAQQSAEDSLAAYDTAPKANPVGPALRRQSQELLAAVKAGKAPPPLAAIDARAAIEAARARYRAREALTELPLNQRAAPLLDQVLGPARSTEEVVRRTRPLLPRAREARGLVPADQGTDRSSPRSNPRAGQDSERGAAIARSPVSRARQTRGLVPAAQPADRAPPRRTLGQEVQVTPTQWHSA